MTIEQVLRLMKQSKKVALIAHVQPDGDSIGSCLALADTLRALDKSVDLYCQDKVPAALTYLHGTSQFQAVNEKEEPYDLTIAIDCSDEERMGTCYAVFQTGKHTMNIDHHISNTLFAEINLVDFKAAATGEVIYRIVRELVQVPSKAAAEALYTGISTDTGGFRFRNTTAQTHQIASELIPCGIDVESISTLLYRTNRLERIRLLERALNSLTLYHNDQIAIITITQEDLNATGAMESEIENMVNYAKDIVGVELGILLKEKATGTINISFRSNGGFDVSELAGQLGGGGHKAAAGAKLEMTMEQARSLVLETSVKALEGWKS